MSELAAATSPPRDLHPGAAAAGDVTAPEWDWDAATRSRLERFLAERGLCDGPVSTRRIGDGHSNLTYLVSHGARQLVIRRPPPPPVPPGGHDVLREARLVAALRDSPVPVPAVLATARAGEVLDVPFYAMSFTGGPVVTTSTPTPLDTPATRREIGEALIDTLAELHAVDWRARHLDDLGRPEGFNARHVRRLGRLVADAHGALPPEFTVAEAWLRDHAPAESGASIVHNDYRIGNVIIEPGPPGRVAAVLDWELATIGDPLFDVGYFLASVPEPGEPLTPTQLLGTAQLEGGYPSRAELGARYAERTGRDLGGPSLSRLTWYTTLALWKLAALYEYSRRRAGTGSGDPYYTDPALVRSFLDAAHRTAGLPPLQQARPGSKEAQ
ncbi:Predicted kinase, aminoglycoside phosphotransferase (APT) family [Frankia canadensis]|uniref:Predicted kinase, aminoglycoside phosphotransferase (APT) family n=1 Tax=Frankia canadensis TaxID=1836972 RepID=A0A2I2KPX5_9ACTN|nr:phosphotransferase family protein [Frankia canadensis]SNQ47709.1 Predicted kinase, aminoglycoside phosphotransferase (APT) family [Frankia canadensis]SOU54999.1 Predicted kinase, aminoglycoside phosphotransferase (APT) family [Frankia canadensis]